MQVPLDGLPLDGDKWYDQFERSTLALVGGGSQNQKILNIVTLLGYFLKEYTLVPGALSGLKRW